MRNRRSAILEVAKMKIVDAKGKNCPIPVIMTKKEIDAGAKELIVEVDNPVAVQNVSRLAGAMSFDVAQEEIAGGFRLTLTSNGAASDAAAVTAAVQAAQQCAPGGSWAVFVGRDVIGDGDRELGSSLMKMFFYTLAESDDLPAQVLLMNAGVKLAVNNPDTIEHLQTLVDKGVELLVCGTCLNFYELSDQLKVGTVSNMYDIVTRMQKAAKVISL